MFANGTAVEGVNVGGAVRRYVSRYFSRKLSRRASHHGAIFASPGDRQICLGCRICPEPKSRIWQMSDKLFVKIKLSRWLAKIVTSLLPQPSVLAFRANFKTVNVSVSVSQMISESRCCFEWVLDLSGYCYFINSSGAVRVCPPGTGPGRWL